MTTQELKLLNIANKIRKEEKLKPITIQFKQVRKGSARYRTRKITIPLWVFGKIWQYQVYYMIHEVSHFINDDNNGQGGHSAEFKQIERRILKSYNINIKYAKAYAKCLYNNEGIILYRKKI